MESVSTLQSASAVVLSAMAAAGCFILMFKVVRSKFPVRVVCWFCGESASVPFGNSNCWDCPHCQQYNGFKTDGDYNKPIPAQWCAELNYPVQCVKQKMTALSNGLCSVCNERQLLKVQQLAVFKPFVESNYAGEVNDYQEHLEKIYSLCYRCKLYVQQQLDRLDTHLQLKYPQTLRGGSTSFCSSTSSTSVYSTSTTTSLSSQLSSLTTVQHQLPTTLQSLSLVSGVVLLAVHLSELYPPLSGVTEALSPWFLRLCHVVSCNVSTVSVLGLFFCLAAKFLALSKVRLYPSDVVDCILWLLLNILTTFVLPHTTTTVLCVCHAANIASTGLSLFWSRVACQPGTPLGVAVSQCVDSPRVTPSPPPSVSSFYSSPSLSPSPSLYHRRHHHHRRDTNPSPSPSPSLYRRHHTSPTPSLASYPSPRHSRSPSPRHSPSFTPSPSWLPLSVQTSPHLFSPPPPSFGSLSRASSKFGGSATLGSSFNSPSPSLCSPTSPSSHLRQRSFSSSSPSSASALYGQFGVSPPSPSPLSTAATAAAMSDRLLGLQMDAVTLGRPTTTATTATATFPSRKSSLNSATRWPHSASSVLSRGDIAPARLISDRAAAAATHSTPSLLSQRHLLSPPKLSYLSDTVSVLSDSIKPSDSKSCLDFGSEDFDKCDGHTDFSTATTTTTDRCNVDSTTATADCSSKTVSSPTKALFLAASLAINVLLIAVVLAREAPLSSYFFTCATRLTHFLTDPAWLQL
ncbi:transmembrane protein 201-like [Argonauta hians]